MCVFITLVMVVYVNVVNVSVIMNVHVCLTVLVSAVIVVTTVVVAVHVFVGQTFITNMGVTLSNSFVAWKLGSI